MRPDFPKVIVERPRVGGGIQHPKGEGKELQGDWDELPKREKIRRKWLSGYTKEFSERLGPLKRYLYSKVGENWNDIYSEIRENLSYDSVIQAHVMTHLYQYVALDIERINGRLYYKTNSRWMKERHELDAFGSDQFYVDPDTGILEVLYHKKFVKERKQTHIWIDKAKLLQAILIDDVWYMIQLQHWQDNPRRMDSLNGYSYPWNSTYDIVFKYSMTKWDLVNKYGGHYFSLSKRQMNSKEIRKYGLR